MQIKRQHSHQFGKTWHQIARHRAIEKHPPHHRITASPLLLSLGLALGLLSTTLPAHAQSRGSGGSDRTGAIITTSDLAGGVFSSGQNNSVITTYTSPQVSAAVEQAAATVSTQLSGGALALTASDISSASLPAALQQSLQSLITGTGNVAAVSNQIEQALTSASGVANTAENTALVRTLISSLQGIASGANITAPELRTAVEAYNALIDASSVETLTTPAPELLAIRAVLSRLVAAALEAQEQQ